MEREDLDSVIEDIAYLADQRDEAKIRTILISSEPADLAEIVSHLSDEQRSYLFELFGAELASDVLPELDGFTRRELVTDLGEARLSEIVDEMDSDEAADVVADLPDDVAETVLDAIDAQDSAEVRTLLEYEEGTAGRIMQLELVSVRESWTVDQAIGEVRRRAEEVENIYNVYVVDESACLIGVLPLKRLVLASPQTTVGALVKREVVTVKTDLDQEDVAQMFKRYNVVALPVVDENDHLLGRITVDDVLAVLEEEASEDIHRMAGLSPEEEYRETSAIRVSRARLPWLLIGLLGGVLAAMILARHEGSLERSVGLAFFVPVVMAMGGNSAFQASTIIIRGLATGEIGLRGTGLRLLKELRVALLNGAVCGAIMWGVVRWWRGGEEALIIAATLLLVILVAAAIGTVVPLVLQRARIDPSLATGPFITTSNDIVALAIYLAVAVRLS